MDIQTICKICESYAGEPADYPFGETPRCYRVGSKIFAAVYPDGVPGALRILLEDESVPRERCLPMVTLHCEPFQGDFYRTQFPGAVYRPYHSPPAQRPHANTVLLGGVQAVPDAVLREMIDHSFRTVLKRLPGSRRKQILAQRGEDGA